MRIGKLTYFILFIGITSLIINISFESFLAKSFSDSNGHYKWNIISAHVNNLLDSQDPSFSLASMHILEEHAFKNRDISYSGVDSINANYNSKSTAVDIYGVSSKYNKFYSIQLRVGGFLNKTDKNENTVVIDEVTAEALFGNNKVIGKYIELYSQKFKIVGVAASDTSLLDTLTDDGNGKVYIGVSQLLELNTKAKITDLDVKTNDSTTIGKNLDELSSALVSIGKNSSGYKITDLNIERALVEQKSKITIFLIGSLLIVCLVLEIKRILEELYKVIKISLREHYFMEVLGINFKVLLKEMAKILILFFLIALIWKNIKFNLYIPSEYIPSDLTDTSFYTNLFKSKIKASLLNEGYIRTEMELKLSLVKRLISQSFYISLISGLPLVLLPYYQNKKSKLRSDFNV